ncbi:hypothetical protein GCM10010922_14040 [Microbacterium sorbitolivorans]|uniref:Cell division protein ZapE n=1 Tax=Microbacterium sorbitolivorans TaxID=1867410 RepID=A0A367Y1M0_9MICO|nr:AFG1/ZapE family ATPase [Microbacterium sorbitolivorans]RCK59776.1 cell division protein ZapE [Microbacterium sorbitolivorans]GGF39872.1 hypothetical protein GCM10010922_14040 [Microbacterium sorbitolivorans]
MDIQRIHDDAAAGGFALDAAQLRALDALADPSVGVYLSGPAGRGKSWLADAWFRHAPSPNKRRVHFHAFLDELHRAVFARQTALRSGGSPKNVASRSDERHFLATHRVVITSGPDSTRDVLAAAPVDPVGDAIADVVGDAALLVFDEFHLHDPADALLLTKLLQHAAARGTRVVATSNYSPDELLPDPVFHDMAEPAIRLIAETMRHVRLDGATDYRRVSSLPGGAGSAGDPLAGRGFAAGAWVADPPAGVPDGSETVRVRDRDFEVVSAQGELWITFDQLCSAATSAIEYLDWAERFGRWIVLDVPGFDGLVEAPRQRFVTAIDVLVDRDVEAVFVSPLTREEFAESAAGTRDAERLLSRLALLS